MSFIIPASGIDRHINKISESLINLLSQEEEEEEEERGVRELTR